jgi:aspartate kinase
VIVVKFGGTSVGDADAIRRVCDIVRSRQQRKPVVVVSALSGTTNELLEIAELASSGNLVSALSRVEEQRRRHIAVARELLASQAAGAFAELEVELGVMFDELANLAGALSVLAHLTPRSLDSIAAGCGAWRSFRREMGRVQPGGVAAGSINAKKRNDG